MSAQRLDAGDGECGGQFITRDDVATEREALVAVNNSREINVCVRFSEKLCECQLLNNHRESRGCDDIGMTGGASRIDIEVDRIGRQDRAGKLADLFTANEVRADGRKLSPDQIGIHGHVVSLQTDGSDGVEQVRTVSRKRCNLVGNESRGDGL